MFLVDPKAIVAAPQGKQLDCHRMQQPARAKDFDQLVGGQQILEKTGHSGQAFMVSRQELSTVTDRRR
jgi:hypothetical protein